MQIGSMLKRLRMEKGLTLREMSSMTGLSVGFLSNLERDINSPTLSSLAKICQALNASLVTLFQEDTPSEKRVVRKAERDLLFVSKTSKAAYTSLSERNKRLQAVCITMEPGGDYGEVPLGHAGDEFGVMLEGTMEITIGGEVYLLEEGDAFYIDAYVPHKYRNTGSDRCVSLWVLETSTTPS
ncbi:MAG: cupin domain-containing protein [Bacillota bacterium]